MFQFAFTCLQKKNLICVYNYLYPNNVYGVSLFVFVKQELLRLSAYIAITVLFIPDHVSRNFFYFKINKRMHTKDFVNAYIFIC